VSDTARRVAGLVTAALCLALGVWLLSDEPAGTAVAVGLGAAVVGAAGAYVTWRAARKRNPGAPRSSPFATVLGLAAGLGSYYLAKTGGPAAGGLLVAGAAYMTTFAVLGPPARRAL
jgi:hypothetical protein